MTHPEPRRAALAARLLACTLLLVPTVARAGQDAPLQQDLYQDALQAIAEGRRTDASNELRRLIDKEPLHAGAWVDLAMAQCALGHGDEAERLFAVIETRFNPSPAMLQLIAETREAGCSTWHAQSTFTVTTGRGTDQNVNQGASASSYTLDTGSGPIEYALSSDFLPHHDQYTMAAADYTRELTRNGTVGFAQFLGRRNDHLHRYDSASLFAGVDAPWRIGRWALRTTGTLGNITLGGHDYQHQVQLQARIDPPLPLPGGVQFALLASAVHTQFLTLANFDSNTYALRGILTHRKEGRYDSVGIGRLDDRSGALRPGGSRIGWYGNVQTRRALSTRLSGELAYTAQSWHGDQPYSPGLINAVRRQLTQSLRVSLSYRLDEHQSLQLEARAVRNRENISIFEYNNHQLQLSWQWQGF
ncbi:tetratricopeptide repeat protein [Massilia putida]|uniref:tetratricopeptide repeat protein n=1 Tax=Massilia putida TaxID=1141883 RepID=UPI0009518CDC|nr:tetratricopeptide repeat protein [Massilia putida]